MSVYSIPNAIGSLSVLLVGLVVFSRNRRSRVNFSFLLFCLMVFFWLGSYVVTYSTESTSVAYFFCRLACTSVMFATPTIYFFFACYLNKLRQEKISIIVSYALMAAMFPAFIFSRLFLDNPYKYYWGYYSIAGPLHPYYILIWVAIWVKGLFMFFDKKMWMTPASQEKNKYILAMYCFVTFGSIDYMQKYGVNIYPFGWIFEVIFSFLVAYTIIKYKFMDIKWAITRTGIFIAVYSLVLGIPYWLAFGLRPQLTALLGDSWWILPLITLTLLATAGPFAYLYIQRKAEKRLFEEQLRYQTTLRQASYGMGRIKNLKRLVNLIVHIVNRTVGLEHSIVYLNDQTAKKFHLAAFQSRQVRFAPQETVEYDSPLVKTLTEKRIPIVYEEIKQRTQDYGDRRSAVLENELQALNAAVAVPSMVDQSLLAIVILGEKTSKKPYSEDDLAVFSILANQAAMAIENAQFYENLKKTHEQLVQAEKMATIGTMADGLSHQINNRLHALGFIAGDLLDTIKLKKGPELTPEMKEMMGDIEHALSRIQSNVEQGGEVVRGLLKYTRKGEEGMTPVDFDQLLSASIEMTQFKIKSGQMTVIRDYPADIPKIKGNFTQLQEVFFNVIDNAFDAMMQRKNELQEPDFKATIKISALAGEGKLNITVEDNGIGVKDEDKEKLFTPFFTTKLSSKKGTGLGLYVIQKIIEENHQGKVVYDSEYKHGTKTKIELPTVV